MSEYIGLARVATDDGYHRLCKFPPFKLAVTRGVKVVLKEDGVHLIGVVKDCCTVERNSAEYYMITSATVGDHKVHDWIVGTVKEFEEEEEGE